MICMISIVSHIADSNRNVHVKCYTEREEEVILRAEQGTMELSKLRYNAIVGTKRVEENIDRLIILLANRTNTNSIFAYKYVRNNDYVIIIYLIRQQLFCPTPTTGYRTLFARTKLFYIL